MQKVNNMSEFEDIDHDRVPDEEEVSAIDTFKKLAAEGAMKIEQWEDETTKRYVCRVSAPYGDGLSQVIASSSLSSDDALVDIRTAIVTQCGEDTLDDVISNL